MWAFLFSFPMEFSLIILFFHYFLKLVRLDLFFLVSIGELTLRVLKLVRSGGSEVMIMTKEMVGNQSKRFPAWNPLNRQIDLFSHKTKKITKELNYQRNSRWNGQWKRLHRTRQLPDGQRKHSVHVSTVQQHIFHFGQYFLFEILIDFNVKCLL